MTWCVPRGAPASVRADISKLNGPAWPTGETMKFTYAALMAGVSAFAIGSGAYAQGQPASGEQVEEIVVTGSRVMTNGNQAPTPVTVMATEQLLETSPSNIPDALNRLPQFAGQSAQRNIQNAQTNATGAFLNLRRFGSNRNLVLLDGSRVPPTAASGAVDINVIPQALVQRVEVVTGGASAVYGSDAVTGVINFVIDKNFNGFKFDSQVGLSDDLDLPSYKIGAAAGTELFGGRGHIEGSFEHYYSKGIADIERRMGQDVYAVVGGAGTAASPFRLYPNGRVLTGSRGGMVLGTPPVGIRDTVFLTNGVPSPFVHGASTGTSGLESGGSGGRYHDGTLIAPLQTNQVFTRFDYDITDSISFNATASYNDAKARYPYTAARFTTEVLSGNPFLPASFQQIMTANNTRSIQIGRLQENTDGHPDRENDATTENVYFKGGFEGKFLDNWTWDANYIFGRSATRVINHNNTYWPKFAAAADAVVNPANGQVVCQVSLTQYAGRFPGCIPFNPFGPTAANVGADDYITDDTRWTLANLMHDVNFAVAGSPFSTWAGPVNVAVSGEYRWQSLRNNSNADPAAIPDCTPFNAQGRTTQNCGATSWQHDVTAAMYAKQNVKEIAGEVLIPLLADVPLFQSVELNLAGRYTDYSVSGPVKTWKVGGTWELTDEFRVRGTMSRDIRAPTLVDLFAPLALRPLGFNDLHTNTTRTQNMYSQGNPDLVPEVARTNTLGFVYQPTWLSGFSLAVDYFEININNAISIQAASDRSVQQECEDSGGTSTFCTLFERPLPFSNHTPDNFPTKTYETRLNSAREWTRGWDVEANYRFDLGPGVLGVRGLVAYQPLLKRQSIPTIAPQEQMGIAGNSKVRVNLGLDYDVGGLSVNVSERWQSKQLPSDPRRFVDARETISAYSYTDITVSYKMDVRGHEVRPFFTVENLFNKKPPITGGGTSNTVPGLFTPTPQGFDVIGRYFTVGLRGRW